MRKAIKDLTDLEKDMICKNNSCNSCPLSMRFGSDPQAPPMCYLACTRVVEKLKDKKVTLDNGDKK